MSAISTSSESGNSNQNHHAAMDAEALKYFIERQPADVIREHVTPRDLRAHIPLLQLEPAVAYVWDKLLVYHEACDNHFAYLAEVKRVAEEARNEPAQYEAAANLLHVVCNTDATPYLIQLYQWLHRTHGADPMAPPALLAARLHVALDTAIEKTHGSVHELQVAYSLAPYRRTALWQEKRGEGSSGIKADQSLRNTIQLCVDVCVKRAKEQLGL